MFALEVSARPDQIPTHIDVDISALTPGDAIRVGDVVLPKGVTASADAALSVVTTRAGRTAKTAGGPEESGE